MGYQLLSKELIREHTKGSCGLGLLDSGSWILLGHICHQYVVACCDMLFGLDMLLE